MFSVYIPTLTWVLSPHRCEGWVYLQRHFCPPEHQPFWDGRALLLHGVYLTAIQHSLPYVQLRDIPREGLILFEQAARGVLVLPDKKNPIGTNRIVAVQAVTHAHLEAICKHRPTATILAPRDTERVPGAVMAEGVVVGSMGSVDQQGQLHGPALVQHRPNLQLVNVRLDGIREDGGNTRATKGEAQMYAHGHRAHGWELVEEPCVLSV